MSSFVKYVVATGQQLFSVPFPYLNRTHVQLRRNGILMLVTGDYDWQSPTQIRTRLQLPAGTLLEIKRVTPDASLINFTNGSVLTEADLNTAVKQSLYLNEELQDALAGYVNNAVSRFGFGGETVGMSTDELLAATAQSIIESTLLASLQERVTDIETNAESIIAQTVRLDEFQTLVNEIAYVDGVPVGNFAASLHEAYIAGDATIQTQLDLIGAATVDGLAWILDTNKVKVSPTETLATRLSSIASTAGDNAAAITTEQTTRLNADNALATSITGLAATVGDNAAAISAESTARANGDAANATNITNLATTVGNNQAAVQVLLDAYSDGSIATATQVTTLQATVDDNTASIESLSSVVAGIDGLAAQYTVKLDVNGYVSGFGLYNTGATSDFLVLADRFAVVTPGDDPVVPFSIVGGTCYMNNVVIDGANIKDLTVTSAQIENLSIGTLKLTDLSVTNAKIANATITTAKIGDAQITNAKIADATITSAKIDNLAVTTAKIADLAVDTLQIAGNAVTLPVAATLVGTPSLGETFSVLVSVSITNPLSTPMAVVGLPSAEINAVASTPSVSITSTDGLFSHSGSNFTDSVPAGVTRTYQLKARYIDNVRGTGSASVRAAALVILGAKR